ncbi:MAG: hypothetical protein ACM3N0_01830 [Chloroflexota bacterium]
MGKKGLSVITAAVLVVTMLATPFAQADLASERGEYKEAVEPICKVNAEANKRILKGVRKLVKQGKLKAAGSRFARAGAALRRTHGELASVPQPEEDKTRLTKWLGRIAFEATLFKKAAAKLKAGNKTAAQTLVIKLQHNASQANNLVISYEFHYCRFEPSKFT